MDQNNFATMIPPSEYKSTPVEGFEERGTEKQLAELYGAIATARGAFGKILKDKTVKIRMTSGGSYDFAYAPMETLLDATVPSLTAAGLAVMLPYSRMSSEKCVQFAIVSHKSGGRLVFSFSFTPKPDIKDFGGQLTYYQRYAYRSCLSLAADADMDEMPEQSRGETGAEKVEKPRQLPKQEVKQPEKQRTPPSSPPQSNVPSGAYPGAEKEHAQSINDLRAGLTALGLRQRNEASAFVYSVLQAEPFPLGDPFCSVLTQAQLNKVIEAAVNKRAEQMKGDI